MNDALLPASATPTSTPSWSHSVHRFSSFNNPAYLFSVRETRASSRWSATAT